MPWGWSLAANSCDTKLSVLPLSAIMSVEEERPPQGEVTGTSSTSKRLPDPGRVGTRLEGCAWVLLEVVVMAWQ